MNLSIKTIKDSLNRVDRYLVIDLDNFSLPYTIINNYIVDCQYLSKNRQRDICYGLIKFFSWLNANDMNYREVTENNIISYRDYLLNQSDQRTLLSKLMKENEHIVELNKSGKSADTVNKEISIIRNFYDYLLRTNEIVFNPCPLKVVNKKNFGNVGLLSHTQNKKMTIDTLKVTKSSFNEEDFLNQENITNKEPFTPQEVQVIINSLTNPQEVLLVCMLFLGMRISEPLGRRISDIKWTEKSINIVKRDDDPEWGKVKYDSYRKIPIQGVLYFDNLPEIMYLAYQQYVNETLRPKRTKNTNNYLFITQQGEVKPLTYPNIYKRLIKENLQKQLPHRKITFHSFRHHMSTSSIAMGTPIEEVQKILGHRYISETIETYYNPSISFISKLVEQGVLKENDASDRVKYILDYKKKFCSKPV